MPLYQFLVLMMIFASGSCIGQNLAPPTSPAKREVIDAIKAGDRQEILQAGSSGDVSLVPLLRSHIGNRRSLLSGAANAARIALAKLGEADQLQIELCRMRANPSAAALSYLGGWFAISESLRMLKLNMTYMAGRNYLRVPSDFEDRDVAVEGPAMTALRVLPQIVPNPPVSGDGEAVMIQTERSIGIWKNWIESHEAQLRQLRPTGEGVDFSTNACRRPPRPGTR